MMSPQNILVYMEFKKSSASEKVIQFVILSGCVGAIIIGRMLTPSPSGIGTHTLLGLPPCGFYKITGIPCPTCGVTTSFVLGAHFKFKESFFAQPVGFVVFILIFLGAVAATVFFLAGKSLFNLNLKVSGYKIAIIILTFVLISWIYKIFIYLKR